MERKVNCKECRKVIVNPKNAQKYHRECVIKREKRKYKDYRKTYGLKHPERVKQIQKKWRDKNPDYEKRRVGVRKRIRNKIKDKEWKIKNRDKLNSYSRKYRKKPNVRKIETIRRYTKNLLEPYIREIYKNKCAICGKKGNLEIHHKIYDGNKQKAIYKKIKKENKQKGFNELRKICILLCKSCHRQQHNNS